MKFLIQISCLDFVRNWSMYTWSPDHSWSGFHTEGGAGIFPLQSQFSLPRNLEIEYGYYISYVHVTEHKYVSSKCSEILSQIASEAIWEVYKFKIFLGGGGMPSDPSSRHACISHTTCTIILLPFCSPPPPPPPSSLLFSRVQSRAWEARLPQHRWKISLIPRSLVDLHMWSGNETR